MGDLYNIYCDESCHLQHDLSPVMVLGATWCMASRVPEISARLAELKGKHGLVSKWECKWTKVSSPKAAFYKDVLDYIFDDDHIHFRGMLIVNKQELDHERWGQTPDDWYYKMLFRMLDPILDPKERYRIYIDIKDTRAGGKARQLHEVLCNAKYDFDREMIDWVQPIRSHESALLQLTDLMVGAIAYCNRRLESSKTKCDVVTHLQRRSGSSLARSTFLGARKFNLFRWQPVAEAAG